MSAAPGSDPAYDRLGIGYLRVRRPDPRIASLVNGALGGARSVLNVGAGTGSYEPDDRRVVAVEPSVAMIAQRPTGAAAAVRAAAECLPFGRRSFDAATAILTLHHWGDVDAGLGEMQRVARDRIVVLTWDPASDGFWLVCDYFPEILTQDRKIFPPLDRIVRALGGSPGDAEVLSVPIPRDCSDGFLGAYWARPEAYLSSVVRRSISTFARLADPAAPLARLRHDLADGTWDRRWGEWRNGETRDLGYRLVTVTVG